MVITVRSVGLTGCVLAVALAAVGCGSNDHNSSSSGRTGHAVSSPSTKATTVATNDPHAPSVEKAPNIGSDGITPLTHDATLKGKAVYPIPGGIKAGKTLAIAINCQGPGKLTVQVRPTGVSFPLLCEKGKVLPTMNEIHMSKNRSTSSLEFTAEPNVSWSFAVGWDPHPPEQG
ncbi:hypothetical protein [Streptomyces griseoruber]|uniref:hypothetical protein n=1 Tax=Streptomyces griseoruber TaxID=1943 RepID=UPI0012FEEECE|nr:hypothetical protein [Streptomyces griseoruber]